MEIERSIRYRVNVSTSVKGIKTYDCTVDMADSGEQSTSLPEDFFMKQVLEKSDALVKALDERYPALKEGG